MRSDIGHKLPRPIGSISVKGISGPQANVVTQRAVLRGTWDRSEYCKTVFIFARMEVLREGEHLSQ
jgi:hypothetical protein